MLGIHHRHEKWGALSLEHFRALLEPEETGSRRLGTVQRLNQSLRV
jgi:hypothetical protein